MNQHKDYLPAKSFRARYGISAMTEWRWLRDEALGLPKPVLIQRRKYYPLAELEAWERKQVALSSGRVA
jgi:predicted DNA-binding transcriptional regulator AlpA